MPRITARDVYMGNPPRPDYQPRKADIVALQCQTDEDMAAIKIDAVAEIAPLVDRAEQAVADVAQIAATGAAYYDTIEDGRDAVSDGATFGVRAGGSDGLSRTTLFRRDSASTQTLINDPPSGAEIDGLRDAVLAPASLYDPATMVREGYYWSATNRIQPQAGWKVSKRIAVTPGEVLYIANAIRGGGTALGFSATDEDIPAIGSSQMLVAGFGLVTVPAGMHWLQINLAVGAGDYSASTFVTRSDVPVAPASPVEMIRKDKLQRETPADFLRRGPNLFDPGLVMAGVVLSTDGSVAASASVRLSGFIPVVPGGRYRITGVSAANWLLATAFAIPDARSTGSYLGVYSPIGTTDGSVTIPAGLNWLLVEIRRDTGSNADLDAGISVVQIDVADGDYPAGHGVDPKYLPSGLVRRPDVIEAVSHNLIDPLACDYTRRHSTGSVGKIVDAEGIAGSAFIPVVPGRSYVIAGAALFTSSGGPQGGYYAAPGTGNVVAIQNITWAFPPSGSGFIFTVPIGIGAAYVVINLWKAGRVPAGATLDGTVQLEVGEVSTPYRPYEPVDRIRADLLPDGSGGGGGGTTTVLNDQAWLTYVRGEPQPYSRDRWPEFSKHMLLKDRDVCVVSVGTSLTARSTEHHTDHPDAKHRPPLLHSRNLASHIWDALSRGWEGQRYARYDDTAVVTEAGGGWATAFNLAEWDDGGYRNGLTRYTTANGASVAFAVPAGTWAWRFIHRTDSVASTALSVAISGGNGLAQVWDEATAAWIEANGYTFSQREAAPATRSVSIPNPDTDVFASSTIASKGDTTYQKRLKLRFIDRSAARTVTITNTVNGTRMCYWGCEWSPRQHMLTYVNAARGSHNTQATQATGLPRMADNEVHGFRPDLIFGELPIHNDGAAGIGVYSTWDRWGRLANNYVWRADYELSLATRAAHFGYTPEFGWWTPSITTQFNGVSPAGDLLTSVQGDGAVMTALDKFDQAVAWVREHHPEAVMIHAVRRWVEAGNAIYGDLHTATAASSKSGPTMTNDGGHANDVGDAILAKIVCGPLDFGG